MNEHFIRWLKVLHTITITLTHAVLSDDNLAAYEETAKQLEELATNIRDRSWHYYHSRTRQD